MDQFQRSIFQCKHCTKFFNNHKSMTNHEHSCATAKCPVCEKWLKKVHLARHLQTVHIKEEEQYNCQNCIYTTNRKDHLKAHKCVKTEYDCDVCDMTFETSENLKNHKKTQG